MSDKEQGTEESTQALVVDVPAEEDVAAADLAAEHPPEGGEQSVPETPDLSAKQPVAPKRRGGVVGWLALLLVLGLAGATYWLAQQGQLRLEQLTRELAQAQSARTQIQAEAAELRRSFAALESQLANSTSQQTAAMQRLEALVGRKRDDWRLAEVEYLLAIANRELFLKGDPKVAAASLRAADTVLNDLGDPQLLPLREQIARDLTALGGVGMPDITGLALTLGTLIEGVDTLPIAGPYRRVADAQTPQAANAAPVADDWRTVLFSVWGELKGLVSVRHSDAPAKPLLAPEEQYFLRQNLTLKLQAARLALLERNQAALQGALDEAALWLKGYFDPADPAVAHLERELGRLAQVNLRPALPDLGASLKAVRARLEQGHAERTR